MIKVTLKNQGFVVSGHALFANPGEDIVCSAVSVTTIGVINEISKIVGEENVDLIMDQEKGFINFKVTKINLEVQTLLNYFNNTIKDLVKTYSKYINIIN